MPLEIQPSRSKWFYARVPVNGRKVYHNLGVRIEGTPPRRLAHVGDTAFELSRARAMAKLEKFEAELQKGAQTEEYYQKIIEARTGARMRSLPLAEMGQAWRLLPRKRRMSESHEKQCLAKIARFVAFVQKNHPGVQDMAFVDDSIAREFMRAENDRGQTGKTYNDVLKLIRSCFARLRRQAGIAENPFDGIPLMETDTIHRIPFAVPEVESIVEASRSDPYIRRLIVVGVCTAMRLGDCARLRWERVNLRDGFIDVKVSKTKRMVTIPIFPVLRDLLAEQKRDASGYVFPDIARQYKVNNKVLTKRVRAILEKVGFGDGSKQDGDSPRGVGFHVERERGLRRASVRDFQSFRVSWVTIALNAGVPLDLVRKVTGHQTVEVVLANYHQPSREDFRRELWAKLPPVLTGGAKAVKIGLAEIQSRLAGMTGENWIAVREKLLDEIAHAIEG